MCSVEEVPLPGNRGRLGSEPGKVGGGCCGREEEDCVDCEGCGGSGVGGGGQVQSVEESQV